MKRMILLISSILIIPHSAVGQVDSIEYNIYEQIYDFKIMDNSYYFKDFTTKQIIESDSLIFESDIYFSNFKNKQRNPVYQDSVQFAIVSRTLKNYNENLLYDKPVDFIRICRFKEQNPVIIKILLSQDSILINYKIGDGKFERKGNVIENSDLKTTRKINNKINDLIDDANLMAFNNNIDCPDKEIWMPNTFFVEIKVNDRYNIFVLTDCNLTTDENKKVFKLYRYIDKLAQNEINNK